MTDYELRKYLADTQPTSEIETIVKRSLLALVDIVEVAEDVADGARPPTDLIAPLESFDAALAGRESAK